MHIHNNQVVFVEIIQTLGGFIKPTFWASASTKTSLPCRLGGGTGVLSWKSDLFQGIGD